ncbi:BnaC04g08250D [Brassica napus]|uniref:(rape) hypothetical protein n=1 Tax=Brassica napus TaxID=3708 RepID=A0A078H6R7_BRANA|nr:unnamed protein product [Brassica napus]CDY33214.1 BnaC04g08250D [Brassica napus]
MPLSYVKLSSTVMSPILRRDSSVPLRLLRLYSSPSLSHSPRLFFYSLGSLLHVSPHQEISSHVSPSPLPSLSINNEVDGKDLP